MREGSSYGRDRALVPRASLREGDSAVLLAGCALVTESALGQMYS
jgi:hypothetical protein